MIMLAGPNGAGKSTIYEYIVRHKFNTPFINADHIQKEELADQSMQGAYQAAKIAAQRRQHHLQNKLSFVSESTFSHPSKLDLIHLAKQADFRIVLYHISVKTPELAIARVASRVSQGGHNVPEEKIRARFTRNQALIKQAVLLADVGFMQRCYNDIGFKPLDCANTDKKHQATLATTTCIKATRSYAVM